RPGCCYNSMTRRNLRRASGDMAAPDVDHRRGVKAFPGGQQIPLDLIVCSGSKLLFGLLQILIGNFAECFGSLKRR
ncbi:hypothetical protein, partial [Bradyrhizobium sp.]|uniref:hypothetical protein n=1 Tax=Bradyrhizobium sp. TaxID=376 RepID=UPI003C66E2E0